MICSGAKNPELGHNSSIESSMPQSAILVLQYWLKYIAIPPFFLNYALLSDSWDLEPYNLSVTIVCLNNIVQLPTQRSTHLCCSTQSKHL